MSGRRAQVSRRARLRPAAFQPGWGGGLLAARVNRTSLGATRGRPHRLRAPCTPPSPRPPFAPRAQRAHAHAPVAAAAAASASAAQPHPSHDSAATGCYLQCVECGAVYAVEAEELDADSRAVQCALCRHEWLACERDLLWGAEHARQGAAPPRDSVAPPVPGANTYSSLSALSSDDAGDGGSNGGNGGGNGGNDEGYHIFVGNLSFRANEQDLVRAFAAYGPVRTAQIPVDGGGASRGYGFVEMTRKADGVKAMRALQGVSVVGRDISLSEARPRRDPPTARERERDAEARERNRALRERERESDVRRRAGDRERTNSWERDRREMRDRDVDDDRERDRRRDRAR